MIPPPSGTPQNPMGEIKKKIDQQAEQMRQQLQNEQMVERWKAKDPVMGLILEDLMLQERWQNGELIIT